METELFDWSSWDEYGPGAMCFGECTLKTDVASHKAGEQFDHIVIEGERSEITLERTDPATRKVTESYTYRLSYRVGELIKASGEADGE